MFENHDNNALSHLLNLSLRPLSKNYFFSALLFCIKTHGNLCYHEDSTLSLIYTFGLKVLQINLPVSNK